MFKPARYALILATLLAVTACSDKNDTSVVLSASDIAAASQSTVQAQTQTLVSSDGKIDITTADSQFTDQLANASQWVDTGSTNNLILLQRDESSGITLSVNKLGAPKSDAATYFKQLSAALNADTRLRDVDVGVATENRMNYRFSHTQDEVALNESCVAIYEPSNLYIACASSDRADAQQLADSLKSISLK